MYLKKRIQELKEKGLLEVVSQEEYLNHMRKIQQQIAGGRTE